MKNHISEEHKNLFYAISTIAGYICDRTPGSELGGAYDLARVIQLTIYNVLEGDGSKVWRVDN